MTTAKQIESSILELCKLLGDSTGERKYNVVRVEANVNGQLEWSCYTPSAGWNQGLSFEAALAMTNSKEALAAKMKEQAADLNAKADALLKGDER